MRITGGIHCGRKLKTPPTHAVRPTQDRVREALFSILMSFFPGARFLDLFAGSGAVGLDALSRGASEVVWVESDRRNCQVLKENLAVLGKADGRVVCADAWRWVKAAGRGMRVDVVYADPPYADAQAIGFAALMADLRDGGVLREGGWFVAEQPASMKAAEMPGWELLRDREYGHTRLAVYRVLSVCVRGEHLIAGGKPGGRYPGAAHGPDEEPTAGEDAASGGRDQPVEPV